MKKRGKLIYLIIFLLILSSFIVFCEKSLHGEIKSTTPIPTNNLSTNTSADIDPSTSYAIPKVFIGKTRKVVKIPAMPEEGFYWSYYLSIPSNKYSLENKGYKKYLLVESNNTGATESIEEVEREVEKNSIEMNRTVFHIGENLTIPVLIPAFPRLHLGYYYNGEKNFFNTHSLDRDTMMLETNLQDNKLRKSLTDKFLDRGFDIETLRNIDKQLIAMVNHAINYLNHNGFNLENDKIFLNGYSASGSFANRFSYLHPEMIKAVACGATLDDMMLPISTYKSKDLIYPIGTYDYTDITGKDFDLNSFNSVARLIFMGEDDYKNTLSFIDCFGAKERKIILSLWGESILPRAKTLTSLYGESDGNGILILDKGIQHSKSVEMTNYLIKFFKSNRNTYKPFYTTPSNPNQLKYTMYK